MEAKFELTEQNYRYLFENASDAMWVHDMKGNFIDVNKAAEKLAGFTRGELIGMNVTKFLDEKYLSLAREIRRKLLGGEELEQPYEFQLIRKDGTTRIVKIATSPVIVDSEVKGFEHTARDITEEKRIGEMLSKITDGSPIATFVIDKQHRVTHWNTAIESLAGIRGEEIIGTDEQWQAFYNEKRPTMADLIVDGASADEIEAYYKGKYRKSRLIGGAYEAEDLFPAFGQDGKWLRFTASPIKNEDGEIVGAIETLRDMSEEKRLQENMRFYVQQVTKAQEEERKRLARDLHDEIAQSLLLVIQRLDTIISSTRPRLPVKLRKNLEELHTKTVEALEGVRSYTKELRPPILDDLGLVATLEWMAEDLAKNQGIDTHVEVVGNESTLPPEVQLLLFRIAQEALTNTRRHGEASKGVVKLEFESDKVRMSVSDNGKGFKLPTRAGDLASTGKLGILGMYERARLAGGALEIKSELGKGTQVVTELPLLQ